MMGTKIDVDLFNTASPSVDRWSNALTSENVISPLWPAGTRVLLIDQWIETGGTMKAAIQLVEKLGATVVGQARRWRCSLTARQGPGVNVALFHAGVAAVAIESSEGGKWIKDNYKSSHCIPEELQGHLDNRNLDFFKGPNNWGQRTLLKK